MQKTLGFLAALLIAGCGNSTPSGGDGGSGGPSPHNWLAGGSGTLASSNDGLHYQVAASKATGADLFALYCVGRDVGWAAGAAGTLLTTIDGGYGWTARATGVSVTLRAVAFADPEVGLAAGDGATVLRSLDGGAHWSAVALPAVDGNATVWAAAIA